MAIKVTQPCGNSVLLGFRPRNFKAVFWPNDTPEDELDKIPGSLQIRLINEEVVLKTYYRQLEVADFQFFATAFGSGTSTITTAHQTLADRPASPVTI